MANRRHRDRVDDRPVAGKGSPAATSLVGGLALRSLVVATLIASAAAAQTPTAGPTLDWYVNRPGPTWTISRSRHFVLRVEDPRVDRNMLDSLEASWTSAVTLLATTVADEPRVNVFVTSTTSRFQLSAPTKGATTSSSDGADVIILVRNDSVRAYVRHEVMHLVSRRAWGRPSGSAVWLVEGLATFVDSACQTSTINVAARDFLRDRSVSASGVAANFLEMHREYRARSYVLAGSLAGFLWNSRGRDGVRRLWQGRDSLTAFSGASAGPFSASLAMDPTANWRAYVERAAGNAPSIDSTTFRRFGCG